MNIFKNIKKEISTTRAFSYSKNIDNKTELKDFRDILEHALEDVNNELN